MGTTVQEDFQSTTEWAMSALAGNYDDVEQLKGALQHASKHCRLIGGATVGPLPLGHEAQLVVIPILKEECYKLKRGKDDPEDKYGFGKNVLTTVWHAAGGEFDSIERVDDNSHPFFAHIRVRGHYTQNNGRIRADMDERDCDYRDGSAQLGNMSDIRVKGLRETILRRAITGAKLRAIRSILGIEHGALESDLDRPFVVCKFVFTGRDRDPAVRLMFAEAIAHRELAASAALYGGHAQLPPPRGPRAYLNAGASAAVELGDIDDDFDPDTGEIIDAPISEPSRPSPAPPPPTQTKKASPPPPPPRKPPPAKRSSGKGNGSRGGLTIPYGKHQGKTLDQLSEDDLQSEGAHFQERFDKDPHSKWAHKNKALADAIGAEVGRRRGVEEPPEAYDDGGPY